MKNVKKILAVVMAVAMLFALGLNAFAVNTDPNMTVGPNTQYATPVAEGSSVTLAVYPADSSWYSTSFNSLSDAATGITATINTGSNVISSQFSYGSGSEIVNGVTKYYATVTVTALTGVYGPASIRITNTYNTNAYIDMTIFVEALDQGGNPDSISATSINVMVLDQYYYNAFAYVGNQTVSAANSATTNTFYGDSSAAQTYATAGNTIDNLLSNTVINSVSAYGGYVSSMNLKTYNGTYQNYGQLVDPNTYEYIGWNYGVLRYVSGVLSYVSDSAILSAASFDLQDGDTVVWIYGSYSAMQNYFSSYPSV